MEAGMLAKVIYLQIDLHFGLPNALDSARFQEA